MSVLFELSQHAMTGAAGDTAGGLSRIESRIARGLIGLVARLPPSVPPGSPLCAFGFGVQGLGVRVRGLGVGVQGLGLHMALSASFF